VIDLGTLDGHTESSAHGINNHGDIVGESWHGDDGRPFLYSGGQMYDLLSLIQPGPYNIINAYGINDLGQILAYGGNAAGESRTFLLTPVPEPETYALMLSGLLMLIIRSKRKLQQSQWIQRLSRMAGRAYAIQSFA
jgi:probable HAF family extracellular repeat protein